jgi:hypothetical protein
MFDLVEMQRGREPLLPEAQRSVRIQHEIAHGFHRQVKTNLIVRSCYHGPTNGLLRRAGRLATCATADSQNESAVCGPIFCCVTDEDLILGENFSNNVRWRALSAPVVVPANPRSCDEWRSVFHTASYARSFDNNRRDYFQLIHGSSASVKPLACGGNKPHVQWSTEEGVTCPRCLRMVKSDPPMRTLLAWSRHPFW